MPQRSGGKKRAYPLWLAGKTLEMIQREICGATGDKPSSVKDWIVDWERGNQGTWTPTVK